MPSPVFSLYELDRQLTRAELLTELAASPARLQQLVQTVPVTQLGREPVPGEWSAFKTCCHLRDAALVYSARFRWIVFDDDPLLPNYDEDNWVASARDSVDDLPAILEEIAASRRDLVRVLSRLPESSWKRTGRHEVIGRVELEPYVRHQLAHEKMHLAQAQRALALGSD
ncbi:MAG: DinB family protein [Dehalococcoidia bacterium]